MRLLERIHNRGTAPATMALALTVGLAACGDETPTFGDGEMGECSIPTSQLLTGQRRDGIPALTNPPLARSGEAGTEYVRERDRVIGIVLGGEPIAVPLNIMWWHEIVNLEADGHAVAVTHCPLTGSSLAFDRGLVENAEFGVSGLLFKNNLVMFDRSGPNESLWPQMIRGARCGKRDGTDLPMVPIVETTWAGWTQLYPETKVVTSNTGFDRDYRLYPYGSYDRETSRDLLFPLPGSIDERRPPKERVLGIPSGEGGITFPFGILEDMGEVATIHGTLDGNEYVILWEQLREGAMAFVPEVDGESLTFEVVDGAIMDAETGSEWLMNGEAVAGPMEGRRLDPIDDTFVAFWFAWPAFYPDIEIWSE